VPPPDADDGRREVELPNLSLANLEIVLPALFFGGTTDELIETSLGGVARHSLGKLGDGVLGI
jgi:hypothetical protein